MPPTVPAARNDVLGSVRAKPVVHRGLVAKVELIAGRGEQIREARRLRRRRISADPTSPPCPATKIRDVVSMSGRSGLRVGGFLQSEQPLDAIHDAGIPGARSVHLLQDVEALAGRLDDANAEPSRRPPATASRLSRQTRIARAFESTTTSRQFSGRSSTTMARSSAAAIRPREPWTTKTLGSGKPLDSSQRCD